MSAGKSVLFQTFMGQSMFAYQGFDLNDETRDKVLRYVKPTTHDSCIDNTAIITDFYVLKNAEAAP